MNFLETSHFSTTSSFALASSVNLGFSVPSASRAQPPILQLDNYVYNKISSRGNFGGRGQSHCRIGHQNRHLSCAGILWDLSPGWWWPPFSHGVERRGIDLDRTVSQIAAKGQEVMWHSLTIKNARPLSGTDHFIVRLSSCLDTSPFVLSLYRLRIPVPIPFSPRSAAATAAAVPLLSRWQAIQLSFVGRCRVGASPLISLDRSLDGSFIICVTLCVAALSSAVFLPDN